jgi:hypothetical protein
MSDMALLDSCLQVVFLWNSQKSPLYANNSKTVGGRSGYGLTAAQNGEGLLNASIAWKE